jgi:hypothetical protein
VALKADWVAINTPGKTAADWTYTAADHNNVATAVNSVGVAVTSVGVVNGVVGNGVADDTAAIQAAINGGDAVFLPPGVYLVSGLTLPSYTSLRGAGTGQTIIKQKPSVAGPLMSLAHNYSCNVTLQSFTLDGNKAEQAQANIGLDFDNTGSPSAHASESRWGHQDPRHILSDLLVIETKGSGYRIKGQGGSSFHNLSAMDTDGHGFEIRGWDSNYSHLDSGGAGLCAYYLDGWAANNRFVDIKGWCCGVVDNTTYGQGLMLDGAGVNTFANLVLQAPGQVGIYVKHSHKSVFSNVHVLYPLWPPPPTSSYSVSGVNGIVVEDSDYIQMLSVVVEDEVAPPSNSLLNPLALVTGIAGTGVSSCNISITSVNARNQTLILTGVVGNWFLALNGVVQYGSKMVSPRINQVIGDTSWETVMAFGDTAGANAYLNVVNSNSGAPYVYPSGAATDIGVGLNTKGAGIVAVNGVEVQTAKCSINPQTGTSYTLDLTDAGHLVTLDNGSPIALTVPLNSSKAFPVGTVIDVSQLGAGQVTIGGASVTFNSTPGLKISARYGSVRLTKLATNTWLVAGDLSA